MLQRWCRIWVVGLVLAAFSVSLVQAPANACKCVKQKVAVSARAADAVFSGVVQRTSTANQIKRYNVTVQRIYKGQVPDVELTVRGGTTTAACGVGSIPAGRRMMFFAVSDDHGLRTTACTGTAPASRAFTASVERVLGVGEKPTVAPTDPPGGSGESQSSATRTSLGVSEAPPLVNLLVPAAALMLLGLGAIWLARRLAR
jgi:hypothetical protein